MGERNHFLAGPGRALLLENDVLIGVAKVLQESGLSLSTTAEEVRGGQSNMLYGQYFHDSNLAGNLTDAMFRLDYMAATLGTNVQSGGLSLKEEQLSCEMMGQLTVSEMPVATDGTLIGFYKKPAEMDWKVGTFEDKVMSVSGAKPGDIYCVKYFWHNENAKSIVIKANYVPKTLHLVLIHDLFAGEVAEVGKGSKYGRIITDIPRFQLEGNQDLSLNATGAATTSLAGKALAVSSQDSCEEDPYYGTMTQEIYGTKWQDDATALAAENSDIELTTGETEEAIIRVVFGSGMAALRKANSNFTFAKEEAPAATATDTEIDPSTGVITAGSQAGTAIFSATLKGAPDVKPALISVTVAGA